MKQYFKRSTGFVCLLAVIAAIVVGCNKSKPPTETKSNEAATSAGQSITVRFASTLMTVDYAPYFVAKKLGWYDEALKQKGLKASYTTFQTPAAGNEAMAGNAIDFDAVAEPPVLVGKAAGIDIKIVSLSSILTQEILVRTQSSIQTIADLKGKKVAVVLGSSSHYGLAKAIEKSGLKLSDVEIINMFPPDAKPAFTTGTVDAWAVWPPWVEKEELAGTGRLLPGQGHVINSLLTVRAGFVKEHPDVVAAVQAVHEKAKIWLNENPVDGQKLVAEELGEPLEVIKLAWPRHKWNVSITDDVLKDLQQKADFLKEQAIIKTAVDVRQMIVPQIIR